MQYGNIMESLLRTVREAFNKKSAKKLTFVNFGGGGYFCIYFFSCHFQLYSRNVHTHKVVGWWWVGGWLSTGFYCQPQSSLGYFGF